MYDLMDAGKNESRLLSENHFWFMEEACLSAWEIAIFAW
jgi:hypothetical protein